MPIYEYQCSACGHSLEAFQRMSEDPLTTCPQCHAESLQKLVSAAGFQLKGTGWYVTDFRGKNPSDNTSSSDSANKTSTSSTTKNDNNTAAPTPPVSSTDNSTKGDKS